MGVLWIINFLCAAYSNTLRHEKTLDMCILASSRLRAVGDVKLELIGLTKAASAQRKLGNHDAALTSFRLVLEKGRATQNRAAEADALQGIAMSLIRLGHYQRAQDISGTRQLSKCRRI